MTSRCSTIYPGHVAATVVYMATLPVDINVSIVKAMANVRRYLGRR